MTIAFMVEGSEVDILVEGLKKCLLLIIRRYDAVKDRRLLYLFVCVDGDDTSLMPI